MRFYYYLFSCAYWVSNSDLKERSAPQDYALFFIFVLDVLFFMVAGGTLNLFLGKNVLNGGVVILAAIIIGLLNYFLFIKQSRFKNIVRSFDWLGLPDRKRRRIWSMIITFCFFGGLAIFIAVMNNIMLHGS
jgi:hypothetical protein